LPWTASQAVQPGGAANRLTVQATGLQLRFSINGVEVASTIAAALTQGAGGLFTGGDGNDDVVEHFLVETPDPQPQ
jgi:hypothetical protein